MKRSKRTAKKSQAGKAPESSAPLTSEARTAPRVSTRLEAIVEVKEGPDRGWEEVGIVETISRNGAGVTLRRPCTVGRLVTLNLPMPSEMRVFDQTASNYRIMGLVQYCNETTLEDSKAFHVGVALIDKGIPRSFTENPLQSYCITGMAETGLWTIAETGRPFKARRHPRYRVALEVAITLLQREKRAVYREQAVTENISASGASIRSSLEANVDDRVKFAYREFDFFTVAVVRNVCDRHDQTATIHVEFIDHEFPVKNLFTTQRRALPGKAGGTQDNAFPEV